MSGFATDTISYRPWMQNVTPAFTPAFGVISGGNYTPSVYGWGTTSSGSSSSSSSSKSLEDYKKYEDSVKAKLYYKIDGADAVEINRHFVLEKAGVSEDMYEDFYGEMSYETADNSFVAVFCCKTAEKSEALKLKLNQALANEDKLSHLSPDAKIFSANGYVFFIVTQNNFDEENLVSKLIQ